jgi:hypothetical protein
MRLAMKNSDGFRLWSILPLATIDRAAESQKIPFF